MFGFFKSSKRGSQSKSVAKPVRERQCNVESLEQRTLYASGPTIYSADSRGKLVHLNLGNGQTQTIGQMSVVMYDIAVSKSGQMYGIDRTSNLYKINKSNASVSKIGSVGRFANALTFAPNGTLYAAGYNKFMKLNTGTGKATVIGSMGNGNNSAGDLAFDGSGNLYLTTTSDKLVKVNVSTGAATTIGRMNFHQVYGMGFKNGVMYGLSNYNEKAFKINLSTAQGTLTSFFGNNVIGANGASFA